MKKATGSFLVPMVLWVAVLLLAASCGTGSTATPRPTFTTPDHIVMKQFPHSYTRAIAVQAVP